MYLGKKYRIIPQVYQTASLGQCQKSRYSNTTNPRNATVCVLYVRRGVKMVLTLERSDTAVPSNNESHAL